MATVTTLIQPKEIVDAGIVKAAPLNARFDASIVAPLIHLAEDRFLKSFICDEFYDDLVTQKNATPSQYNSKLGPLVQAYPSNADYETLWTQYLLPYMSRAVYCMAIPEIAMQTGSNGIFFNNTQHGQPVGLEGIKYMEDIQLNNLMGRKPKIIQFLCDNTDLYPLFCTEGICKDCCDDCKNGHHCKKHGKFPQEGRDLGIVFY